MGCSTGAMPAACHGEIRHAHSTRDSNDLPQILYPRKCAPRTPVSSLYCFLFFIGLLIPVIAELH